MLPWATTGSWEECGVKSISSLPATFRNKVQIFTVSLLVWNSMNQWSSLYLTVLSCSYTISTRDSTSAPLQCFKPICAIPMLLQVVDAMWYATENYPTWSISREERPFQIGEDISTGGREGKSKDFGHSVSSHERTTRLHFLRHYIEYARNKDFLMVIHPVQEK